MDLPTKNLDYRFLWQLMAMVATELINDRHYRPWADRVILDDPQLPNWVINLSMARDSAGAIDALYAEVGASPPLEIFKTYPRDWIACQWLKYRDGIISYPVFLSIAGTYSDRYDVGVPSDEIDRRLNEFMAHPSKHMEAIGADWVETKFHDAIERMAPLYRGFQAWAVDEQQDGQP